MNDIDLIYYNYSGTSFYLKRCTINELNKIQLVFNKKALHLTKDELYVLKNGVKASLRALEQLEMPVSDSDVITIALEHSDGEFCINLTELKALDDLICGTLFHMNFNTTIANLLSV